MRRARGSRPSRSARTPARSYGEDSRELILAAAQKLFAIRGLHATSMLDIAKEANVSRATVFNQFGSKHLVLDAITALSLAAYRDLLAAALADETTLTPDILRGLFAAMSHGLERNRALYREVFTEIRKVSMGLDGDGISPGLREQTFEMLVHIFARGQARADISRKQSADVLATAFDSLLSGAVAQWLHAPGKSALEPLLASLVEVFLDGVATRS
jgi:AcrR family transcriptional regulator